MEGTMEPEANGDAVTDTDDFDLDTFDWNQVIDLDDEEASTEEVEDEDADQPEGDEDADGDEDEEVEVEGEPPADETTAPKTFTVKVQGEDVTVTLDELQSGYMRQADYTRKTQAVADDAKAAAAYRTFEQRLAADPDGTIAALRTELGLDDADLQDMDPLEREVHELRTWRTAQERQQTQTAIEAELAAVKVRYAEPELDEDALLAFAVDNGIGNLDVAYKAMTFEAKTAAKTAADEADTAAAEAEAQRQAKVAAKRGAPKVTSGAKRAAKTSVKGASEFMSVEEALAEALSELRS